MGYFMAFAVVERILEKHATTPLTLCDKQLSVSALPPQPDALPLLSCEIDHHRLLFNNLPDTVDTDSLKKYLQRASVLHDKSSVIGRVVYGIQRGIAMAVFQQPYGKRTCALLTKHVGWAKKTGLFFESLKLPYMLT